MCQTVRVKRQRLSGSSMVPAWAKMRSGIMPGPAGAAKVIVYKSRGELSL